MALKHFRATENINVNGDEHPAGDIVDMTDEQVENYGLVGKVEEVLISQAEEGDDEETPEEYSGPDDTNDLDAEAELEAATEAAAVE